MTGGAHGAAAPILDRRPAAPGGGTAEDAVHDARALVNAGGKASILLDDQVYTLRITKQGKLLLTK